MIFPDTIVEASDLPPLPKKAYASSLTIRMEKGKPSKVVDAWTNPDWQGKDHALAKFLASKED